jgi:hypothetical protein
MGGRWVGRHALTAGLARLTPVNPLGPEGTNGVFRQTASTQWQGQGVVTILRGPPPKNVK